MNRTRLFLPAIVLLLAVCARPISAQNLYINKMMVGVDVSSPTGYCNDVDGMDGEFLNSLGVNINTEDWGSAGVYNDDADVSFLTGGGNVWQDSALIEFERPTSKDVADIRCSNDASKNYCYPNSCLGLCAALMCVTPADSDTAINSSFAIDEMTFEIFKFGAGSNPLDPASTPPLKTISLYNIGTCQETTPASINSAQEHLVGIFCAAWDGTYNLNGQFGKTNGQYGFRATVKTNQVNPDIGTINITQTSAYPGQNQIPIQVNVTNIHSVRSSPTVVGKITGVAAQPYNILYRLSKDATTTIKIYATGPESLPLVRTLINGRPRVGEGAPDGTLTNGDFWDGRDDHGNILPSGVYLAQIEASSNDMWAGTDLAWPTTVAIGLDPLQVTDIAIKALGASSTEMANVSYLLTEAATAYVGIYTPGTSFENINSTFNWSSAGPTVTSGSRLRLMTEQKIGRSTVSNFWDGRDESGTPVCDGDYSYAIWAELPTRAEYGGVVMTPKAYVGTLPVARGYVNSYMSPSSTVLGSTPAVANLDPFYFRYTPSRDAYMTLNIKDMSGNLVRTVLNREVRPANLSNRELWNGKDNSGRYVSSGTYLAELIAEDPFQCPSMKISTVTALISVDMFRIVDVRTTPLLGGASDTAAISFELSQTMYMDLKIYPPEEVINPSVWPYTGVRQPVYTVSGLRPGRFKITEYWDGRDKDGLLVSDGRYPFTLTAQTSTTTGQGMMATDKTYGYLDVARGQIIFTMFEVTPTIPTMYNSSDSVKLPPFEIDYVVTRQSSVTVQVLDMGSPPRVIANVVSGGIRDGVMIYKDFWDGKDDRGNYVTGDSYNIRVIAQDIASQMTSLATVQQTIDVNSLRIFDVSITPLTLENPAVISYQVSEPMRVVTKIYKPGTSFDAFGVPYPQESSSLVKRIIGVRPARTQISEYWDGTDMTLSKVPDGSYIFKIYGSTSTGSISAIDGSIAPGTVLADDIVTANIPVTKGGTADLCGDFEQYTFFAPNPYEGLGGWFRIHVPINGRISLKLFNLAADLVYKKDFGVRAGGEDIDGLGKCATVHTDEACWPRVNSSGGTVAPGVYLAVLRFEATEGTKDVCQVVKKILIP